MQYNFSQLRFAIWTIQASKIEKERAHIVVPVVPFDEFVQTVVSVQSILGDLVTLLGVSYPAVFDANGQGTTASMGRRYFQWAVARRKSTFPRLL
jgi:hypothetical protein